MAAFRNKNYHHFPVSMVVDSSTDSAQPVLQKHSITPDLRLRLLHSGNMPLHTTDNEGMEQPPEIFERQPWNYSRHTHTSVISSRHRRSITLIIRPDGTSVENSILDGARPRKRESVVFPPNCCQLKLALRFPLNILRVFGLFPSVSAPPVVGSTLPQWTLGSVMLILYSCLFIGITWLICGFNIYITIELSKFMGPLSIDCISSIINGTKPLHCAFNLLCFGLFCYSRHCKLLVRMQNVDESFQRDFNYRLRLGKRCMYLCFIALASFGIPCLTRITQFVMGEERLGDNYISDSSLLVVPLLSVWQILPLLYFDYLNVILRAWFRKLFQVIQKDSQLKHHSMRYYYSHFLQLTSVCFRIDRCFRPFISLSLSLSVAVLCLTIYFLTSSTQINLNEGNYHMRLLTRFYIFWSTLQIATVMAYVGAICVIGTKTNEQARSFNSILLSMLPEEKQDQFAMGTIMGTYAIALNKLNQKGNCERLEQMIGDLLGNSSNVTTIG